jgi:hypothetical protein
MLLHVAGHSTCHEKETFVLPHGSCICTIYEGLYTLLQITHADLCASSRRVVAGPLFFSAHCCLGRDQRTVGSFHLRAAAFVYFSISPFQARQKTKTQPR